MLSACSSGVSISNGYTAVSLTPSRRNSGRAASHNPDTPHFDAEYAPSAGQPCTAAVEARQAMAPFDCRNAGTAARRTLAVPTRLT